MRWTLPLLYTLTAAGQSSPPAVPSLPALPKNPTEVFAAAAPLYDFSSATLKPWHMKVSYQLYGDGGKPRTQGVYEYWWASPGNYRSSWSRPGMEHSEWMVKGEHYELLSGSSLDSYETQIEEYLLRAIPDQQDLADQEFVPYPRTVNKVPLSCVTPMSSEKAKKESPVGEIATYCFESGQTVLRMQGSTQAVQAAYANIILMQGRLLAHQPILFEAQRRVLNAVVDETQTISPDTPELVPNEQAKKEPKLERIFRPFGIVEPKLIKSVEAEFPESERTHGDREGLVRVRMTVGMDGRVHDAAVVSTTSAAFTEEALRAVKQYRFEPARHHGVPVEMDLRVEVRFRRF
jgi:TonB family protein